MEQTAGGDSATETAAEPFIQGEDPAAISDALLELQEIHKRIDVLAARLMGRPSLVPERTSRPGIEPELDIYENDREFLIHAAVPGAEPDKVRIDATPHTVTLTADLPTPRQRSDTGIADSAIRQHRRSRLSAHEHYHFIYTLHVAISPESARAHFSNGIVEIHLPKATDMPAAHRIPLAHIGPAVGAPAERVGDGAVSQGRGVIVNSREGSPGQKLGAAYFPNAGEDHLSKSRSIGE